jgi:hypothetical protein
VSRSRRKNPFTGFSTADSEKEDKRIANRKERRKIRQVLPAEPDPVQLPHRRELSNVWSMDKDGKRRVDPEANPKLLRK